MAYKRNNYHIKIEAKGPIYIGDGSKIGNREYVYDRVHKKVIIPDIEKLYMELCRRRKEKAFQDYMMGEKRPLDVWIRDQDLQIADIEKCGKYVLDAGDYFIPSRNDPERTAPPKEILCFVKDPYGEPYVPGSSLKGVFRTALLCWLIYQGADCKTELEKLKDAAGFQKKRTIYLKRETENLEQKCLHTLKRKEDRMSDAVNSIMSGLIVGDSKPLKLRDLMLSQKIDYSYEKKEKQLPILRESLKPGTLIEVDVSLDHSLFPYTMDQLMLSLNQYNESVYSEFGKHYDRGNPEPGILWLGGGVGYPAKSMVYPVYPKEEAFGLADQIMRMTLGKKYEEHRHNEDRRRGLSPHTYKCTRYNGTLYDMGMAKIVECSEI